MGTRVEQSSEFLPRASRTSRRHLEDMADSLHRLPSAAEDLQVIIPRCNRTLLLQGEFCITVPVPDRHHIHVSPWLSAPLRSDHGTTAGPRLSQLVFAVLQVLLHRLPTPGLSRTICLLVSRSRPAVSACPSRKPRQSKERNWFPRQRHLASCQHAQGASFRQV